MNYFYVLSDDQPQSSGDDLQCNSLRSQGVTWLNFHPSDCMAPLNPPLVIVRVGMQFPARCARERRQPSLLMSRTYPIRRKGKTRADGNLSASLWQKPSCSRPCLSMTVRQREKHSLIYCLTGKTVRRETPQGNLGRHCSEAVSHL
jgi:hypothetical protein